MKIIKSRYNQRINVIFALTLVIGVVFSSLVYWRGVEVSSMTNELITEEIPNYELLRSLANNMTEQERILYEYYADDETERLDEFQDMVLATNELIERLVREFGDIQPLMKTQEASNSINEIGLEFGENMAKNPTDWPLARVQLKEITRIREEALPQIGLLLAITGDSVLKSENLILNDLEQVRFFVIGYGVLTLIIAYIVAKAFKAYLSSSATSQRLALFPMRNPNPVISIDNKNSVTYRNPASDKLLTRLEMSLEQVSELLAPDLKEYQINVLSSENKTSESFQFKIKAFEFECELHWHEDQQQWDLHLTDITDRKKAEYELNFLAFHNPETELRNQYQLARDVDELYASDTNFTLGLFEIRSFSQLIAGRGIDTATQVTKEVSKSLEQITMAMCPNDCCIYHIGEKSFAFLTTIYLNNESIHRLVADMNKKIAGTAFSCQSQVQLDYGFSLAPEHGSSYTDILKNARTALDTSARNDDIEQILFNPELGARLEYEQQLISDMREAIEEEGFELYFQPQLSLKSKKIIGAEVLIRWNNKGKWISPGEFIPLAESSGLIVKLGDWILRTACIKALKLIEAGLEDLVVAVNISPKQFGRSDFLDKVRTVLEETGLPPRNLELEITEGVIIYNEEETIETLTSLKNLGVMLAIDDFGTGYSSLSYLKKFDIDKLKIDQSFVRHIQTEQADESIVRTIIDLGRNLHLKLIAEGVEEIEQLEILKSLGCDEIQGYFFSKPLPENAFVDFVSDHKE
ncbi:GGDEF domain-containing protein [Alteromonadaceae bacterium M269]|nr:GGDEF domain-containing protein [Alteromonadaceae bacterium M269]